MSWGLRRMREIKNYKRLVSVNAIRPAVSVSWQSSKIGFCLLTETGRQRP